MKEAPTNLDWVSARSGCSLTRMFRQLTEGVEQDVRKRSELREEGERVKFTTVPSGFTFNVYRDSGGAPQNWVYFKLELEHNKITVQSDSGFLFEATVTLNDFGECKLKVDGVERELWQVSRLALEELFFGSLLTSRK